MRTEIYDERLWGVVDIEATSQLSHQEIQKLKEEWADIAVNGWGKFFAAQTIHTPFGELYVFWGNEGPGYFIQMERDIKERRSNHPVVKLEIQADEHRGRLNYTGATLELPASDDFIKDALQRAHVKKGGGYQLNKEVNRLAYQISRMDEERLETFEGAIILRAEEDCDTPITLKELINIAYNLDCFEFRPGVLNDTELGKICIENGMVELLNRLPDDVIELLDLEKVGEELRRSDQGTFTSKGYVFKNKENFQMIYDGGQLPEIYDVPTGTISLRVIVAKFPHEYGVWIDLPTTKRALEWALNELAEASFKSCLIVESTGAALPFPLTGVEDIEDLNTLTKLIDAFPDSRTLAKYKAALELEHCDDLALALDIAANLDSYNFDQEIFSPARYAEYLLEEAGFDTEDPAFKWFDFEGFGERKLKEISYIPTAYGLISRNEIPFRQEYTRPQNGMKLQ